MAGFARKVTIEHKARIRRQIEYTPKEGKRTAAGSYKAVSIVLENASKISDVASMDHVVKVYPVEMHFLRGIAPSSSDRPPQSEGPQLSAGKGQATRRALRETDTTAYSAHVMLQIDKLHRKGITGKGIKIALIDTGVSRSILLGHLCQPPTPNLQVPSPRLTDHTQVDYEHPALGGCFGPGCLFSFGTDLVHGEPTPRDCNGHGTSVAGIIGKQPDALGFTGAAPGAQLGMYRITCSGSFASDVMVDAIYRALNEGVDIISSSAGLPGGWPDSLLSAAAARAVESGVVFVQGTGNDGEAGLFTLMDPAVGHGVISVGSVRNRASADMVNEAKYTIGDDGIEVPFHFHPTIPSDNFTGTPMQVYAMPVGDDTHRACGPLPPDMPDLSDKLVLLPFRPGEEGHCSLRARIQSVHEMGAAARILAYQAHSGWNASTVFLEKLPEGVVGVGMLGFDMANAMLEELQSGRNVLVTAHSRKDGPVVYVETPHEESAGAVSAFSSWGPSWNLGLRPSLTAVGEEIMTTVAGGRDSHGYTVRGGTSATGPLIAAVVALIGEARGSLDAATVESLLVSHSYPQLYHDGKTFLPYLAPVAQQGGGLARAYDAAYATTLIHPAGLSFSDTEHRAASLNFTIKNVGQDAVTYRLSHVPAVTMYVFAQNGTLSSHPRELGDVKAPAAITLSDTIVTVAPGNTASIRVSASAPDGLDASRMPLWSGWIAINGSDSTSLSVPYQGFSGSIRKQQVLAPDGASLVYQNVSVREGTSIVLPAPGSIATSQLVLNINAALGTPLVRAEVVSVNDTADGTSTTTTSFGQVSGFPVQWRPNSNVLEAGTPDLLQFTRFEWNGQLDTGDKVPKGPYKLVVRALRIFGNPDNDDDWDISESPVFDII